MEGLSNTSGADWLLSFCARSISYVRQLAREVLQHFVG